MRATLDVGDAAMHRGFVPTEKDLTLALDIVEGVLAPIYDHRTEAEKMADRVPPAIAVLMGKIFGFAKVLWRALPKVFLV
jgi:hypothetical protein